MNEKELKAVCLKHIAWLNDEEGGERADLYEANLRGADLYGANLRGANLREANLYGANLRGANLRGANLREANLRGANLYGADLRGANLRGADLYEADLYRANLREANLYRANLREANLYGANLRGANLRGANLREANYWALQCPDTGSFIAWKKCVDGVIVKLLIPETAKRSSATSRKCRASEAVVLDIIGAEEARSSHDLTFVYRKGETVNPDRWDDNRWDECSHGIHFFITKEEAENY